MLSSKLYLISQHLDKNLIQDHIVKHFQIYIDSF
nr:MAG TPA: hypothetical protein [Caudoviricetes sp.]